MSQDVTDPFVDVKLGNARIAKTSVIDNDLNPEWNETFRIEVKCVQCRITGDTVQSKSLHVNVVPSREVYCKLHTTKCELYEQCSAYCVMSRSATKRTHCSSMSGTRIMLTPRPLAW